MSDGKGRVIGNSEVFYSMGNICTQVKETYDSSNGQMKLDPVVLYGDNTTEF